jgi:hypothetical protein
VSKPFAYRVMYMTFLDGAWQTDCSVTGWATLESLPDQLAGAYEQVEMDNGRAYIVLTLPPGEFFDDGPSRLEVVH